MDEKEKKIMAAISSLTPHQFCLLIHSLSSEFRRQQHHLFSLLQSPTRFPLILHHLQTLSLHQKSLLIARYLLSMLTHLTRFLETYKPNTSTTALRLKDMDAALLLMLLCQLHQQEPHALQRSSTAQWRSVLKDYQLGISLSTLGGLGGSSSSVLTPFIDIAIRCRNILESAGCGEEMEREVAASVAAVVALPSVELSGGGVECVICREQMREGREVCELPCDHLFHWMCVLPWLKKNNTCPCCRFQLPTDDVFSEIQRLWEIIVTKSRLDSCE